LTLDLGILFSTPLREPIQRGLHVCQLFFKVCSLYHHDWHENNVRDLALACGESDPFDDAKKALLLE